MIYNVFLCDFDDETLIRSYFNDIVSDLATFTFVTKDSSYDTSLRPADTITVYTAAVDATANYADNSVVVTFVVGDTQKKFVNKLFKTILYNLDVDVASVLYDNRFNGWVRTNYPAAIYSILDNESKSLDDNELFSGSSDFMELFYKYQANLISDVDTSYVLPIFGMQKITFKSGLQVVVRTGEEKNITLIGNGTVIAVYSHTINPEVEYEYGIVNKKENENDVITFTIGDDIIINELNIGNTYADNEGTVGITSVATVSISDMTIEPLTYYYDDFSGGTINCDNDIVSDVKDRYFSIGTIPHKVTGGIELIGASTIFIRSYKYKDADIKMYINPVASDTEFNIHFMKQFASVDTSIYNGHYVNILNGTVTYHRYILGSDSSITPITGLTYPINTSHIFQSTIKDGVLTFKIDGDIIFTTDVDSPYPEIYDYGYIGIENKTSEKSLIISKIEINGDEKFGRGIQVGRYIDDFDYNSEGEYR